MKSARQLLIVLSLLPTAPCEAGFDADDGSSFVIRRDVNLATSTMPHTEGWFEVYSKTPNHKVHVPLSEQGRLGEKLQSYLSSAPADEWVRALRRFSQEENLACGVQKLEMQSDYAADPREKLSVDISVDWEGKATLSIRNGYQLTHSTGAFSLVVDAPINREKLERSLRAETSLPYARSLKEKVKAAATHFEADVVVHFRATVVVNVDDTAPRVERGTSTRDTTDLVFVARYDKGTGRTSLVVKCRDVEISDGNRLYVSIGWGVLLAVLALMGFLGAFRILAFVRSRRKKTEEV